VIVISAEGVDTLIHLKIESVQCPVNRFNLDAPLTDLLIEVFVHIGAPSPGGWVESDVEGMPVHELPIQKPVAV